MKYFILYVLPLIISCSLFDNEQALEINPNHLIGEWRTESFYNDLELIEPAEFDTSKVESAFKFVINKDNTCEIIRIKLPNNLYTKCGWELYGSESELYFRFYYSEIVTQWYFDYSFIYRVREISEQNIDLKYVAHNSL